MTFHKIFPSAVGVNTSEAHRYLYCIRSLTGFRADNSNVYHDKQRGYGYVPTLPHRHTHLSRAEESLLVKLYTQISTH